MNSSPDEMTMEGLAARLAELEEAHTRKIAELEHANTQLREELTLLRAVRPPVTTPLTPPQQGSRKRSKVPNPKTTSSTRKSRRGLLRQGLEVAAAGVGAGALLELNTGSVHAFAPTDNPGNFSSSDVSIPAVTATGTKGAIGVFVTTNRGTGVFGHSKSSTGVFGGTDSNSAYGVQGHDGSRTGTGTGVYGKSVRGLGVFGESLVGTGVYGKNLNSTGVKGQSMSGLGVYGQSSSFYGVSGFSDSGAGVYAESKSGTALVVNGTMQLQGNSVGVITFPKGNTSVTVTSSAATPNS